MQHSVILVLACVLSLATRVAPLSAQMSGETKSDSGPIVNPGGTMQRASSSAIFMESSSSSVDSGVPSASSAPQASSSSSKRASSSSIRKSSSSARASSSSQKSSAASSLQPQSTSSSSQKSIARSSRSFESFGSSASSVSSSSSSEDSSSSSSSIAEPTASGTVAGFFSSESWQRERIGYSIPVIDPEAIASPTTVSRSSATILANLLLAMLVTLVLGLSAQILLFLFPTAESQRKLFARLPLQVLVTIFLIELLEFLIPSAMAQGFSGTASASFLRVPLYAFLFFLVVGASNSLFNAFVLAERHSLSAFTRKLPRNLHRAVWVILTLIILYGIVGAYINPAFSLFQTDQIGMVIVTIVAVIIGAYTPDSLRFILARTWRSPSWFQAHIGGLLVTIVCVYLSRKFNLNPGFIYGLPVGLLISLRDERHEGPLEFWSITWMLVLALIVWFATPLVASFEILFDTGNVLFVVLIEAAFLELLPLGSLAGHTIFRYKKFLWALLFFISTFLLYHSILNPQGTIGTLQESPPALFTVLILGCYAAGIFLLWGYMIWKQRVK